MEEGESPVLTSLSLNLFLSLSITGNSRDKLALLLIDTGSADPPSLSLLVGRENVRFGGGGEGLNATAGSGRRGFAPDALALLVFFSAFSLSLSLPLFSTSFSQHPCTVSLPCKGTVVTLYASVLSLALHPSADFLSLKDAVLSGSLSLKTLLLVSPEGRVISLALRPLFLSRSAAPCYGFLPRKAEFSLSPSPTARTGNANLSYGGDKTCFLKTNVFSIKEERERRERMETAKPGRSPFHGFLKTVKKLVLSDSNTKKKRKREKTLHSLLSGLFLSISAIKASYAELQLAESPLNLETIQSTDHAIISELNHLSLLKHSYLTEIIPQSSYHLAELQEQKNLIKIFRITVKKLQSELLERETQIVNLQKPIFLFPAAIQEALSAASSFAGEMFSQLEFAGWDLEEAISAMDLRVLPEHKVFAFESFVSSAIFSGFHLPDLGRFEEFCRTRYRRTVHPSVEETFSLSWKTEIFSRFVEMAKKVWALHRIFSSSFGEEEERGIFKMGNGCRFSEVFMESVVEMEDGDGGAAVGFTVAPGFCLGKMVVVRCKVYPFLR